MSDSSTLHPQAEAAVFLWLMNIVPSIKKLGEEYDLEYGWLLDHVYSRLSREARSKITAVIVACAEEEFPHEPPVEAVASSRTLRELARERRRKRPETEIRHVDSSGGVDPLAHLPKAVAPLDIEPLLMDSKWDNVHGIYELLAIFAAEFPGLKRAAAEQTDQIFPEPPSQTYFDKMDDDGKDWDRHKVRRLVYAFQREFNGYVRQLGHENVYVFRDWIEANKIEVEKTLKSCEAELHRLFQEHLDGKDFQLYRKYKSAKARPKPDEQRILPISGIQIVRIYDRGCFLQEPLRIKFYCFLKAKGVTVPEDEDLDHAFLYVAPALKSLLKDLQDDPPAKAPR